MVLIILIVSLSFVVQNYTYNGILQALNTNSRELTNVFIDYKNAITHKYRIYTMIKSNINCKITIYNKLIWETIRICILDFVIYYTLFFPKIKDLY